MQTERDKPLSVPREVQMDVEKIAAGLSATMRDQVRRDAIGGDFTMATVRALRRRGLFEFVATSPNGKCGPYRITPLGLAVRTILERESNAG